MSSVFDEATYTFGVQGPPGAATVEQVGDLETRLAAREAITIPTVLNDMTDVSGTPTTGDLLQYDGSGWVPYTPVAIPVPFVLPMIVDGTVSIKGDIELNFAATAVSWHMQVPGGAPSGSIELQIYKNGVSIAGTTPPAIVAGTTGDGDVSGWTATTFASGDVLSVGVATVTTITTATLSLAMTRSLTWGG